MADPTPGNTTIGIELEFVLLCRSDRCQSYVDAGACDELEEAAQIIIWETLAQTIETDCLIQGCDQKHGRRLPLKTLDARDSLDSRVTYSGWIVHDDITVELTLDEQILCAEEEFMSFGIEISSRIMNFNKPTPCPGPRGHHDDAYDWRFEIGHVLELLDTTLNNPHCPDFRILVNSNCGFHVHVGGQHPEAWPHISRGITTLYTAFERHIDRVLPTYRIGSYSTLDGTSVRLHEPLQRSLVFPFVQDTSFFPLQGIDNDASYDYPAMEERTGFSKPLSLVHMAATSSLYAYRSAVETSAPPNARNIPSFLLTPTASRDRELQASMTRLHIPAWMFRIMSTRGVSDLKGIWPRSTYCHDTAVNLEHISDDISARAMRLAKYTIEFRAFPGTLEIWFALAWVELQAKMMEACANSTSRQIVIYALERWSSQTFTIVQLAQELGASPHTVECFRQMLTEDFARGVYDAASANEDLYQETTTSLKRIMQLNRDDRYNATFHRHVEEKIRWKFERGLYGKFPKTFVDSQLPHPLAATEGHKLTIGSFDGISDIAPSGQPLEEYEENLLRRSG